MLEYKSLKEELQKKVVEQLASYKEWDDVEITEVIDAAVLEAGKKRYISHMSKLALRQDIFNSIRRLDLLQELLDDKDITEIMVNGSGNIFFEKNGRIGEWNKKFESEEKLNDLIQQIVGKANRQVNSTSPIVDTSLPDGSRVNVVLKPIALNGPILTIRKFYEDPITVDKLVEWGSVSREAADVLGKLVTAGYNIFVSGSTGSGKTTFLNALADFIPKDERVITIEDSAELQIRGIENLVRLEVRNANSEGDNEISIRDLIKTSLRMRPNRIIVGEVRGPEAIDMLQAMNTGHDGSLSTGHANSVEDMLRRLETMVLMGTDIPATVVRQQIASSIDIIVQLGRLRDKTRRVLDIVEVVGYEEGNIILNPLYEFRETGRSAVMEDSQYMDEYIKVRGNLIYTGNKLINRKKLLSSAVSLDGAC